MPFVVMRRMRSSGVGPTDYEVALAIQYTVGINSEYRTRGGRVLASLR